MDDKAKALAFLREEQERIAKVTGRTAGHVPEVTGGPGPLQSAADGMRGPCGEAIPGEKIAKNPAGPAPEKPAARVRVETVERVPPVDPTPRTNPNRAENEFMMNIMIVRNALRKYGPACRDRARRAGKWVWRDIRMLTTVLERIQEAMLRTMPEKRDEYYRAYATGGHYELHMNGPIRNPRLVLISDKHLGEICEAAMKSECILCQREGSEIDHCPLRAALLETAAPAAVQENVRWRKCEYRDAAGQLVLGKEITI